jgi:hypothetical protein
VTTSRGKLCCKSHISETRYSGHQDSRLMGLVVNKTKQAGFPTIREGRAERQSCLVPSEVESMHHMSCQVCLRRFLWDG